MLQPASAQSVAASVYGTLSVECPDELVNELRPQVSVLYPGMYFSEYSSDGRTAFVFSGVLYPVELARYALANLCRPYAGRAWVCWSWVPPKGREVLPGGTISVKCEPQLVHAARQEMLGLFPGAFLYEFPTSDGWMSYSVDAPCPDMQQRQQLEWLLQIVKSRSGVLHGYVTWCWYPWFDEEAQ